MIRVLTLLIYLLCFEYGIAQHMEWETCKRLGISFSYPKNWTEQKLNSENAVVFRSMPENPKDTVFEWLMVSREDAPRGDIDIDGLQRYEYAVASLLKGFQIVQSDTLSLSTNLICNRMVVKSETGEVAVLYAIVKGNNLYNLIFGFKKSVFEERRYIGDEVVRHLVIDK